MLRFLGLRRERSLRLKSQASSTTNFPGKFFPELTIEETQSTEVDKQKKKVDDSLTTQIAPRSVARIAVKTQINPSPNETSVYILEDTNLATEDKIPVSTLSAAHGQSNSYNLQLSSPVLNRSNSINIVSPEFVEKSSASTNFSPEQGAFTRITINKNPNITDTTTHNTFTTVRTAVFTTDSTDSKTTSSSLNNELPSELLKNVIQKEKEMAGVSPTGLSPETVPVLDAELENSNIVDEITPMLPVAVSSGYGAADPSPHGNVDDEINNNNTGNKKEKKKGKDDKKDDKKATKAVSDALKTDMAAERTFFKWLWTGLHTGAIGSFIFVTFDTDKNDPKRLLVVGFSWLVALCLVLYGTFVYYRRRRALRSGEIEEIPEFTREHSPLVVVLSLLLVIGVSSVYALSGEEKRESIPTGVSSNGIQGGQQPVSAGNLGTG